MQVMNSKLSHEEIEAVTEAARAGILVYRHTFGDGPDRYERIVLATDKNEKDFFGSPIFTWADVISLGTLREMMAAK